MEPTQWTVNGAPEDDGRLVQVFPLHRFLIGPLRIAGRSLARSSTRNRGASLDVVGAEFHRQRRSGPRGGKLGHRTKKNLLTNRALMGRTFYSDYEGGHRTQNEVVAKWPPIVHIVVFTDVECRLAARTKEGNGRHRRRRGLSPLRPVCAHCGYEYNGGRTKKEQGSARQYTHVNPKERAQPDEYA